jgi:hypothetical protein
VLPGLGQNVGAGQLHALGVRKQTLAIHAGQCGNQSIFTGRSPSGWHSTILSLLENKPGMPTTKGL